MTTLRRFVFIILTFSCVVDPGHCDAMIADPMLACDACWHADRDAVRWHIGEHHRVGTNHRACADGDGSQNSRSRSHPDVVLDGRVAVLFGGAHGVVAEEAHPVADLGATA